MVAVLCNAHIYPKSISENVSDFNGQLLIHSQLIDKTYFMPILSQLFPLLHSFLSLALPFLDDVSPFMGLIQQVSKVVICHDHAICLLGQLQHEPAEKSGMNDEGRVQWGCQFIHLENIPY